MGKLDYFIYLMIAFIFYLVCNNAYNVPVTTIETPKNQEMAQLFNYENLKDPEQVLYINLNGENIKIEKNNYTMNVYPQAKYRIYAMVMSKTRYIWGWDGDTVPYDLALAWNELMLPENQKGITYTQSNRWYYYQFDSSFPLEQSYVNTHSANHHIIPANKTVFNAIDRVRIKEKIYIEGYLVNIKGKVDGKDVWRNTSLTRNDTGDGACEVFYVKRVVLDGKIYE